MDNLDRQQKKRKKDNGQAAPQQSMSQWSIVRSVHRAIRPSNTVHRTWIRSHAEWPIPTKTKHEQGSILMFTIMPQAAQSQQYNNNMRTWDSSKVQDKNCSYLDTSCTHTKRINTLSLNLAVS